MRGARLVTASETNDGVRLDEALVKKITGHQIQSYIHDMDGFEDRQVKEADPPLAPVRPWWSSQ
jgi:hypothetical protein